MAQYVQYERERPGGTGRRDGTGKEQTAGTTARTPRPCAGPAFTSRPRRSDGRCTGSLCTAAAVLRHCHCASLDTRAARPLRSASARKGCCAAGDCSVTGRTVHAKGTVVCMRREPGGDGWEWVDDDAKCQNRRFLCCHRRCTGTAQAEVSLMLSVTSACPPALTLIVPPLLLFSLLAPV